MKQWALSVFTVLIFFGLCPLVVMAQQEDRGKQLYEAQCALCHGENGKGNGPASKTLGSKPADLTSKKVWDSNAENKIKTAITEGHGAMPPMDLKQDEITAITDYMSHNFKK